VVIKFNSRIPSTKRNLEIGSLEKRHSTGWPWRSDDDHMESEEAVLLSKCRVTYATNNCPHNPSEKPTSKTIQIKGSPENYST
jgi:hypothetical protein